MSILTTHVLNTAQGCPAEGVEVILYKVDKLDRLLIKRQFTNADGRVEEALLSESTTEVGIYELVFVVDEYFRNRIEGLPDPMFVNQVTVRFGIADISQHYHVPLLVSPWSYSTYRGS